MYDTPQAGTDHMIFVLPLQVIREEDGTITAMLGHTVPDQHAQPPGARGTHQQ